MKTQHFAEDYNKLVQSKLASQDRPRAMEASIGGNFQTFGRYQRQLLQQQGLSEQGTLLDLGCGAGRLAHALRDLPLHYVGIDVVQELLDYAAEICQRPDWHFIKSTDLTIPLQDDSVDMVCAFSLFTHLLHEETYAYLAEARRVLKPGGKIVFTFLEFAVPEHWAVFVTNLLQLRQRVHLNQFIEASTLPIWCRHLRLDVLQITPGNVPYIQLTENTPASSVSLGQSLCVLQKPHAATDRVWAQLPEGFDPQSYLAANPDVAQAGIDAAAHYLAEGQYENRPLQ